MTVDMERALDGLVRAGRAPDLHGVVVMRHGDVVFEHYGRGVDFVLNEPLGEVTFGPGTLHDIRSVTKSVVGLLYGTALAAGQVPEPREPLLACFPEYADLAGRTELTVEHALTMTLGLEWNEDAPYTSPANSEIAMELAPDRYRYVLERPVVEEPGTRWRYCGGASALIGALIARGTGMPLEDFARTALFEPLGIAAFEWSAGGDGVAAAASGLRLAPRDLARIGAHVLASDDPWVARMLRPRVTIGDDFSYGYQWYMGSRWYGGFGNGGQRLYVRPDLDLVAAVTAGQYNEPDQPTATAVLEEVVLPAFARS
ncbi:serine hydrolase domain-containing protein [Sphaerisporangium fuscum]|uniref:serine hydrolase domain-containing protein n=1 Tax=Sphaerisporangium fuscum TaxID=2835868 RepID=UPI001BDDC524|nr:serine hydrolase domain-containing protein [Sphaerisporangium fuscum]